MITIESNEFSINAVMLSWAASTPTSCWQGLWNKIPWRVWLHEPSDSLVPSQWILELGDHRFPLRQSSSWEQDEVTKSWEQAKSSWRIRTADGRWVPSLRDLGADLTID
jgi:hypothetical protein